MNNVAALPQTHAEAARARTAAAADRAVIAPGHTFGSITDKITSIVLTQRTPLWWYAGFAGRVVARGRAVDFAVATSSSRASASGATTSRSAWAFDITNFVWWIGIGHAGTLISAILLLLQADVADLDQPLRRGDDALRGGVRRHLPAVPHRPAVARVLAAALPEHDERVAAVQEPARLGRVRRLHLRARLVPVLVRRPDSRSRDAARSLAVEDRPDDLRHPGDGLARLGAPLASLRDRVPAARRAGHAAGRLGAHRRQLRLRGERSFPAGTRRSSRPTSSPAPSSPASRWC